MEDLPKEVFRTETSKFLYFAYRLFIYAFKQSHKKCEWLLEFSWNVMAHSDAWEGKWRGNWWMDWVASTLHTTSEHGVSSITTADAHTSAASSRLNAPADLNGPVCFAERQNLVSARVPSHFKCSLPKLYFLYFCFTNYEALFFYIVMYPFLLPMSKYVNKRNSKR